MFARPLYVVGNRFVSVWTNLKASSPGLMRQPRSKMAARRGWSSYEMVLR
jgi:hypothetical protein